MYKRQPLPCSRARARFCSAIVSRRYLRSGAKRSSVSCSSTDCHPILTALRLSLIHIFAEAANGDIWVGSADGLFRLSGGNWSHFTAADGLSHRVVLALAPAKNGDLWVGYRYGGGLDHIRMNGRVPEVIRPANNPAGSSRTVYFLGFDQRLSLIHI